MAKQLGWYLPERMVLKVTLARSNPKIWRRVEVDSGLTLEDLHYVIQCVFDWQNSHLYHFLVTPGGKTTHAALRDAVRYHTLPTDEMWGEEEGERADEVIIGRIFREDCRQIIYEYDFGDSWCHLVRLEKRAPAGDEVIEVPRCIAGAQAAPHDDMGGVPGYYMWLEALQNAGHNMHGEAKEWLGEAFDPAQFDLEEVNRRLKQVFKPAPKRKKSAKRKGK